MSKKRIIKHTPTTNNTSNQPKKTFWQLAGTIFIGFLIVMYILQISLNAIGYKYNKQAGFIPSTDYEIEHGFEIIKPNHKIITFYEKTWDLQKALENVKATKVVFDNGKLNYEMITSFDDDFNTIITGNAAGYDFDTRLTISDKDMYMYFKTMENSDVTSTYIHSQYDDSNNLLWDINTLLTPITTVDRLSSAKDYSVVYNCRTEIDGVLYDDILVRLDALTIIKLLVSPDTGNVMRILTPCFNDDYTEILYETPSYSEMDFNNLIECGNKPIVKLPDGNFGNEITIDEFYIISDTMFRLCTGDVITLISDDIYDSIIESEVNSSVE